MALTRQEAEEFGALKAMVTEIHLAVVGNGSAGSSARERLAKLEAQQSWRHKAIQVGAQTLWTAAVAAVAHSFGVQLPTAGGHG
jgi:hypothetical protein